MEFDAPKEVLAAIEADSTQVDPYIGAVARLYTPDGEAVGDLCYSGDGLPLPEGDIPVTDMWFEITESLNPTEQVQLRISDLMNESGNG
jgi:hypothetical protein